jgi:hypothetical protein
VAIGQNYVFLKYSYNFFWFFFAQISSHVFICYVKLLCYKHLLIINSTHLQIMSKPLKINLSIPFTSLFYKTSHSYNKLYYQVKMFPKVPNIVI